MKRKPKERRMVPLYPEVYHALQARLLKLDSLSMTEYVNRAMSKVLNIPFEPRVWKRPYYVGNVLPKRERMVKELDLTPIGVRSQEPQKTPKSTFVRAPEEAPKP